MWEILSNLGKKLSLDLLDWRCIWKSTCSNTSYKMHNSFILVYRPCVFFTIESRGWELCLQARCYNNWFLCSFKRILQEQKMMKLSIILIRNTKFTLLMKVSVNVNNVYLWNLITTETNILWKYTLFPPEKLIHHNLLFQVVITLIII